MINKYKDKTAVGIITCNRQNYLEELLGSIDPDIGSIFVVNAGDPIKISPTLNEKVTEVLDTEKCPTPVGLAKNKVLRHMRHAGYEYLFLIEDDVRIKDNKVFEKYIETAAETGLWAGQLCYGTHGGKEGGNVKEDGSPNVIETVDYDKNSIDLYPQSFQAFTLYHTNVFPLLGYFDEFYINAAEHLDHYFNAFAKGLGSYFWFFPDIENSSDYLEDIDEDHKGSVIRKDEKWQLNFKKAWAWFGKKYGYTPTMIPKASKDKVIERLNFIEKNYSRKDLLDERE